MPVRSAFPRSWCASIIQFVIMLFLNSARKHWQVIFWFKLGDLHEHIESFFDLPVQQHNMNGREDSQKKLAPQTRFQSQNVWVCSGFWSNIIQNLVDGFNPFEKDLSNWIVSPNRDENKRHLTQKSSMPGDPLWETDWKYNSNNSELVPRVEKF